MSEAELQPKRKHRSKYQIAQPPRGMQPGKRGPNKTPAEYEAERLAKIESFRTKRKDSTSGQAVMKIGGSRSPEAKELADLIQHIGAEEIDPIKGWTRIEMVVRKLYVEAASGKVAAMDLLFNRGWGRVPMPVKVNIQAQLHDALNESGLSMAEANEDPFLRFLLGSGDMSVESNSDSVERSDAAIESTFAGSEDGAGPQASAGAEGEQDPD